ncbi:MAG: type II toxin-antitoxin system VapC family toxin [Pseudomonadota bacterium]
MRLVIDASVAVKWILNERPEEAYIAHAAALLEAIDSGRAEVYAPPHWTVEVMSVVARLLPGHIDPALELLGEINPRVLAETQVLRHASQLASQLRQHLFDTLYHAVALEVGATLVTADRAYLDKARHLTGIIHLTEFAA